MIAALSDRVTAPRQVLPGATYLVSRRCAQRQFLLRPSTTTNAVFLFVLAAAARLYGMQVHAFCVMSNHLHLLITDPDARLPAFLQFLHAFVARAINASIGHWEAFWAPGSYSAVRLVSPDDIVDKTAYVLANPVTAGLVRSGRMWPGVWSDPDRIGAEAEDVERPDHFFGKDSSLPKKVGLELTVPPGFQSAAEFRERVTRALKQREREEKQRLGKHGFLGVAAVLKQNPRARPASVEPRRGLSPRVAARDKWKRIEALSRLTDFLKAYRAAWLARRAGKLDAEFPAGTYLMRLMHGVPCAAAG